MQIDETVSQQKERDADSTQRDLAPVSPAKKLETSMDEVAVGAVQGQHHGPKLDLSNFKKPEGSKHKPTIGEKIHWGLTYIGGDWLLNSAVGVTFTFLTTRSPWGKRNITEPVISTMESALSKISYLKERPDVLKKGVNGAWSFLNIMVGGTAINPILTSLESHKNKKGISRFFDRMIHGKDKVETDPKFQEAYDAIDREPVKDTKSVWISRGIALAPLFAIASIPTAYSFMKNNEVPILKHISFDSISNFSKKITEKMGIKPKKLMERTAVNPTTGHSISDWQALHDTIGFDYGLTILYAFLHAAAFSAVARFRQNNRLKKADNEADIITNTTTTPSVTKDEKVGASESQDTPKLHVTNAVRQASLAPEQALQLS